MSTRQTMLAIVLCLGIPACCAHAAGLLGTITVEQGDGNVVLKDDKLTLEFDRRTGRWESLRVAGIDRNLISPSLNSVDFIANGQSMIDKAGVKFAGWTAQVDALRRWAGVTLRFTVGEDFELTCAYRLVPGKLAIQRFATATRKRTTSGRAVQFEGFTFQLPGIALGEPSECTLRAPGPFWPDRFIHAGMKYETMLGKNVGLHSAPDAGFGLLAMENSSRQLVMGSWMRTNGEVAWQSTIQPAGQRLAFHHRNDRCYRLVSNMTVESDVHHVEFAPDWRGILAAYRDMAAEQMPLATNAPPWTRQAIILEVYPRYFPNGFKGITARLPFYRHVGFNVVYLMPHWQGGYSPIDPFAVDEQYGTKQDLQALVRRAHELGMKVLFDMVIHGFNEKSRVPVDRPEMFCKDEKGQLARHPAWKSITTDWASPAYQQYMVDLVMHDLNTYDIDGYRVDAQTFKGANWDPELPYPAYRSGSASHEVIARMLAAMRERKPDAAMLSEVFGPLFYSTCDLVHDNQTEAPQWYLEMMDKGHLDATHYKDHMADVLDMLLPGANRVMFARNHDTSWFYHFNGYTPRYMALDTVHCLFAAPEVFAGDPRHKPNPDDDPKIYEHYRRLFALRRDMPELADGQVLLREVACDNRWVFSGIRQKNGKTALVLVSFSDKPQKATVGIKGGLIVARLRDALDGKDARIGMLRQGQMAVEMQPFQILVGRTIN